MKRIFHPTLEANLSNSLNYLMEINRKLKQFKDNELLKEKFLIFMDLKSKEYILTSNYQHTVKLIEDTKEIFTDNQETKENKIYNPGLRANLYDSLNYLKDINHNFEDFQNDKLSEENFINFLTRRSIEYGYIANFKHTEEIILQLKDIFTHINSM
jgi:hypothetical protein